MNEEQCIVRYKVNWKFYALELVDFSRSGLNRTELACEGRPRRQL